jgi:hypothetical protein
MMPRSGIPALGIALLLLAGNADAVESIEYLAEHLPEIAMDNRYASLPLWSACAETDPCVDLQAAYQRTHAGSFSIDGPLLALGAAWKARGEYRISGFVFYDGFVLDGGMGRRPLDITFADPPLTLPAGARFDGLDGTARDFGAGIAIRRDFRWRNLPACEWTAGLMWQRLELRGYEFSYRVTDGTDAGSTGTLDYDATYTHFSPLVGVSSPSMHGAWRWVPHILLAMPLPRRGLRGRITGPGFDLRGDAADNGAGKHFGDPSVTIGFDATYVPWRLTLDLGSTLSQALVEPKIHEGVQSNWLISAHWSF